MIGPCTVFALLAAGAVRVSHWRRASSFTARGANPSTHIRRNPVKTWFSLGFSLRFPARLLVLHVWIRPFGLTILSCDPLLLLLVSHCHLPFSISLRISASLTKGFVLGRTSLFHWDSPKHLLFLLFPSISFKFLPRRRWGTADGSISNA